MVVKHTHCARKVKPTDDQTVKGWEPRFCLLPRGHKGKHLSSARMMNYFGLHDRCVVVK